MPPQTLYQKLWNAHVVAPLPGGEALIYIDRQIVHEVSSPQAFVAMREGGRALRRPETHLGVADHAVPTHSPRADGIRHGAIANAQAAAQIAELEANVAEFGVPYAALDGPDQGIVHVIGPESGFTLPGTTLVCGDSHTTTHGAFGALAFGIGSSEQGTVMAAQCLRQKPARTMRIDLVGARHPLVFAKDIALAIVARLGADGASGHAVEFTGEVVRAMSMAERMTLCNMMIEAGARIALVAPDEVTYAFVKGRRLAPKGDDWAKAVAYWQSLASDRDAVYDQSLTLDAQTIAPQVSWGTTPDQSLPIGTPLPDPSQLPEGPARAKAQKALAYMGLEAGQSLTQVPITHVFIGSCTNGRIEDLRAAAGIAYGRKVAAGVKAIVVPGSAATSAAARAEGLDRILIEAGFEWRLPGCSMCIAMNDDRLAPGERCASTSNRNFEGRQGVGGRTHLMSPAMAAAAALAGHIADVREYTA